MAVAVSGGADSLATALLVRDWARGQGGDVLALVVDHGLRAESAAEARLTMHRLAGQQIAGALITLVDLEPGPALAVRARSARHAALEAACAARGILHLVFGHHAGDQAETICMRMLARSHAHGLAGMSPLVETPLLRRLRPLLSTPQARLRATLRARGLEWVEDPSNTNPTQQRARLRKLRGDLDGDGVATQALLRSATARGKQRAQDNRAIAAELAEKAEIHPQGYAVLQPGAISAEALAALIGMVGGAAHPISADRLRQRAAVPRAATMAGVRMAPAGRFGAGWLLLREAAAIAPPAPAHHGMVWDGRFRLISPAPPGALVSSWGEDAPRGRGDWPGAALRALPVLRLGGAVISVNPAEMHDFLFAPSLPAASAPFFPLPGGV